MSIKERMSKWGKEMSKSLLTLFAVVAVTSASQASWWFLHQPKEPECLTGDNNKFFEK